jgi:hypothetical protein
MPEHMSEPSSKRTSENGWSESKATNRLISRILVPESSQHWEQKLLALESFSALEKDFIPK